MINVLRYVDKKRKYSNLAFFLQGVYDHVNLVLSDKYIPRFLVNINMHKIKLRVDIRIVGKMGRKNSSIFLSHVEGFGEFQRD